MCNRYEAPPRHQVASFYRRGEPDVDYPSIIVPLRQAPFVLADRVMVGQWGLIPPSSPTRRPATEDGKPLSTNNARRERLASARSFRKAWQDGQRCIVPAVSFDEPCWETLKNVWWRFWRADGDPWALAGIWSEWADRDSGELVPSFTLITQNCDGHPLLGRMHKPDPKLPADRQDKRTLVVLERERWDQWLLGTAAQAEALIQVPPLEVFRAEPLPPEPPRAPRQGRLI